MFLDEIKVEVYTQFMYPGMILKGDGFDEQGQKVIDKEVPITQNLIDYLSQNGIKMITYSREKLKLKKQISNSMISDARLEKAFSIMQDIEGAIRNGQGNIPSREVEEVIDGFITDIKENENACLNLLDLENYDDYTYTHSLNVSTLAILTGIAMNLEIERIRLLGIGGLLHDIGKTQIPNEIINKAGPLTDEEWKIVRNHPVYSYNLLKAEGGFNMQILNGILLHHENYKGNGYPFGLTYEKTNAFAQIITVVDVFDAITSKRSYKDAQTYSEAFTFIMENSGIKFHPKVAQVFLRDLVRKINEEPLYPQNCYVLLNTGEVAYVVDYRQSKYTLRPIINIFFNPKKKEKFLKFPQQIDLEQVYDRYIIKRIDNQEYIAKFNQVLGRE